MKLSTTLALILTSLLLSACGDKTPPSQYEIDMKRIKMEEKVKRVNRCTNDHVEYLTMQIYSNVLSGVSHIADKSAVDEVARLVKLRCR